MYYSEDLIEEVRSRNDIVDVISGYVRLQRRGSSYFGLCPFHNEKSPSFSVSPGKQMYYCFGCGAGGNVFTFLMEYENYTFPEAVKTLADRCGVELPEVEYSEEARRQADLKSRLLEIQKKAARYYFYELRQPKGRAAYEYLKGRALSDETIKRLFDSFSVYSQYVICNLNMFSRKPDNPFQNLAIFRICPADNIKSFYIIHIKIPL